MGSKTEKGSLWKISRMMYRKSNMSKNEKLKMRIGLMSNEIISFVCSKSRNDKFNIKVSTESEGLTPVTPGFFSHAKVGILKVLLTVVFSRHRNK